MSLMMINSNGTSTKVHKRMSNLEFLNNKINFMNLCTRDGQLSSLANLL